MTRLPSLLSVQCWFELEAPIHSATVRHLQCYWKMYARIVASTHPTKKYRGAIKNQIDVPTTPLFTTTMPRKRALTLGIPKKPSPQRASQQAPSPSSPKPTSPSPQPQNTQLESQSNETPSPLSLSDLSDVEDTSDPSKAIDYLIEYQFAYEKDILLQDSRAVEL